MSGSAYSEGFRLPINSSALRRYFRQQARVIPYMHHKPLQYCPGFIRKQLHKIFNVRIDGTGNHVDKHIFQKKKIQIDIFGNNNTISIDERNTRLKLRLHIFGNNNRITIGHSAGSLHLEIGAPIYAASENIQFVLGNDCWLGDVHALVVEKRSKIIIGDACAFANVTLWASDTHSILNQHGQVTNRSQGIIIGNKVWFGKNTSVLKNTLIGDYSVVGWGSVVAGRFPQGHCVLAGVPARIIRQDIDWDGERPDLYKG